MTLAAPADPAQTGPRRRPGRDEPAARTASRRARLHERLGFRLSALLAVALLPLGLAGLLQAGAWRDAARQQAAAALMGETLRAAAPEVGLIREAQGAAAAAAQSIRPLIADDGACVAAMTALNEASPQYSVAAFVPASGLMTCGSGGRSFDYRDTALFLQMQAEGFPAKVYVQERGPVSGVSVVLVAHPVAEAPGGPPIGYVALALPHAALVHEAPPAAEPGSAGGIAAGIGAAAMPDFVTFNGDGAVLTTSRGFGAEAEILPVGVNLAELGRSGSETFLARTAAGEERDYAVVPVVPGTIYALGTLPARRAFALVGPVGAATPLLATTLMWAVSLVVAWLAAERLVTRHMRRLASAMAAFAGGAREVEPLEAARAPAELREVAAAFGRMTDTILHDEAELEDGLRQREVLLREVHHRSKNNLQLIASIMNMQARRVGTPEARALMRSLQERVMSLATIHRELYQTTGVAAVRADELLGAVARQVVAMHLGGRGAGGGRGAVLAAELAPLRLAPDQAVPLALLLTEALVGALRRTEGAGQLTVSLGALGADGTARLAVEAWAPADGPPGHATPAPPEEIADQLLTAFAAQIDGRLEIEEPEAAEGPAWRLAVTFPVAEPPP